MTANCFVLKVKISSPLTTIAIGIYATHADMALNPQRVPSRMKAFNRILSSHHNLI